MFEGERAVYRMELVMANGPARALLEDRDVFPLVKETSDHCCVCIEVGRSLAIVTRFPFPVQWKKVHIKFSRRGAFVVYTVPPMESVIEVPFSAVREERKRAGRDGSSKVSMMSTWCLPIRSPIESLPRLDIGVEWSHEAVSF